MSKDIAPNRPGHNHCLQCGEDFEIRDMLSGLVRITDSAIACSKCGQMHEFDDLQGRGLLSLVGFMVFLIVAPTMIYLALYTWNTQGYVLYLQLIAPLLFGVIAAIIARKIVSWYTRRLVKYGE